MAPRSRAAPRIVGRPRSPRARRRTDADRSRVSRAVAWRRLLYRIIRHPLRCCSVVRSISRSISGSVTGAQATRKRRSRACGGRTLRSSPCCGGNPDRWGGTSCCSLICCRTTWQQWPASGSSTCSISSRTLTGRRTRIGTTWRRHCRAARIYRSSPVLQWFTGSIGLHHVHHAAPRIPNYRLQTCHDENALFHRSPVVTRVPESPRCVSRCGTSSAAAWSVFETSLSLR